jgi:hypothetical protein
MDRGANDHKKARSAHAAKNQNLIYSASGFFAPALRTDHGVDFIDLPDHLRPALRGNGLELFLGHPENKRMRSGESG